MENPVATLQEVFWGEGRTTGASGSGIEVRITLQHSRMDNLFTKSDSLVL